MQACAIFKAATDAFYCHNRPQVTRLQQQRYHRRSVKVRSNVQSVHVRVKRSQTRVGTFAQEAFDDTYSLFICDKKKNRGKRLAYIQKYHDLCSITEPLYSENTARTNNDTTFWEADWI